MEESIRLVQLSEISASRPLCINHRGVPYCVVLVNSQPKAYITICSHKDKVFTPQVKDHCLVCPFHEVCFDVSTGAVRDRNGKRVPEGLHPVVTEVRDGWVYLKARDEHRALLAQSEERRQQRRMEKERGRRWLRFLGKG